MSQYGAPSPPPGWYPDPANGASRYWDGSRWGAFAAPRPGYPQWQPPLAQQSTTAAIFSHFGFVIGGPILPLIIYLVTDRSDRFTRAHSAEALNFQLTVLIFSFLAIGGAVVLAILTFGIALVLMIPLFFAAAVLEIVWCVMAAVAAGRHEFWDYPWNIRMVKP